MEIILVAGVNIAVWNLAWQRHQQLNDPAVRFDRGLGDRVQPGLHVNERYNPETGKLNPSTHFGENFQFQYAKKRAHSFGAACHERLDPYRVDTEHNMKTNRMQRLNDPSGLVQYADLGKGGRGRLLGDKSVTVSQLPISQS